MGVHLSSHLAQVGIVVIGRNEGERLKAGLRSLPDGLGAVVYVDSGSTDDSIAFAESMGVEAVALDMSVNFTAARARNSGFARLQEILPDCRYVQFMDGDCRLADEWIQTATKHLDENPTTTAVWGSRREIATQNSQLNTICDIEWNQAAPGETRAFGGDVMMRRDALQNIGGYRNDVIAAEDDEVSIRLRQNGGRIERIDAPMTFHDASMTRVSQWWKRARRAGYAFGLVNSIHGAEPEYYFKREISRTWIWGAIVPALVALGCLWNPLVAIAGVAVYLLRAFRIGRSIAKQGQDKRAARAWGLSCAFCAFPQFAGLSAFLLDRLRGRTPTIIEYK